MRSETRVSGCSKRMQTVLFKAQSATANLCRSNFNSKRGRGKIHTYRHNLNFSSATLTLYPLREAEENEEEDKLLELIEKQRTELDLEVMAVGDSFITTLLKAYSPKKGSLEAGNRELTLEKLVEVSSSQRPPQPASFKELFAIIDNDAFVQHSTNTSSVLGSFDADSMKSSGQRQSINS